MNLYTKIIQLLKKRLVTDSLWNMSGQIIPLVSAIVTIPILLSTLGNEKFGFLVIALMLTGYFTLFDFGIGRAITYSVAKKIEKNIDDISTTIWTGLTVVFILGLVVAVIILRFDDWIIYTLLNLSESVEFEAKNSLNILLFSIPIVILSSGLRGALEGIRQFKIINLSMIPLGSLNYILPAIVSFFTNRLEFIIVSLLIVRVIIFITLIYICNKKIIGFSKWSFNKFELVKLIQFGGWMTVSNIIGPVMVNMDRVFISSILAVSTVTFYVVPFDIVSKILIFPSAISNVLFPEFSFQSNSNNRKALLTNLKIFTYSVALILFICLSLLFVFSFELLSIWISEEFAMKSSPILKILCIGIFINGIAFIPYSFIQGLGRSDITAKFHIFELIIYMPLLYYCLVEYGVIGAAYAWVIRASIDACLLFAKAKTMLNK